MIPSAYRSLEVLADGPQLRIVRGERLVDSLPVIIKSLRATADFTARQRLQNHLRLATGLHIPGIPQIVDALDAADGYIVMHDGGALTLSARLATGPLSLDAFFAVATDLTRIIADLHDARILHRDIAPQNILLEARTLAPSLIDLGLGLRLDSDGTASADRSAGGTIQYVSPEQTGRMNRRIDARSDLYGLGAVFFAMLTGRPPFVSDDPSELLHAHIARKAPHVRELLPGVPFEVDELVDILLRKDPEERYRSARILLDDLTMLHTALRNGAPLPALRGAGSVRRIVVPNIVAGRDAIIDRIVPKNITPTSPRIIIVRGEAGIGKSAVVRAAAERAARRGDHIGRGSYDRVYRGQPASAITAALMESSSFLKTLEGEKQHQWREHISDRLRGAEAIVAANLPHLRPYFNDIGPLPELAPREAQARSLRTMELLAAAIAPKHAPMLLVLEDVQWADTFSMDLIERVVQASRDHALSFLCSVRDGEEASDSIVDALVAFGASHDVPTDVVAVPALDTAAVSDVLATALRARPAGLDQAALLIHRATRGNALAVRETIRHCGTSGTIRFDAAASQWVFDFEAMARLVLADSSSDYLTEHVRGLSDELRSTLVVAVCLGMSFVIEDLADARELPANVVTDHCTVLANEGLLYHRDDGTYHIMHDRAVDAARDGIDGQVLATIHRRIADGIAARTAERGDEFRIFELVHHGNAALSLLTNDAERIRLAERNLLAARVSRRSAAFAACAQYATMTLRLLNACRTGAHIVRHEATLLLAECKGILGEVEGARTLLHEAVRETDEPLHRADLFGARMDLETVVGDMPTAFRNGVFALRELGIELPSSPTNLHVLRSFVRARFALRGRRADDLLNHAALRDERARRALRILDGISTSAYYESTLMIAVAGLERARIAFTHGLDDESIDAVAFYAMTLTLVGMKRQGARFADIAEHLAERGSHPRTHGMALFVLGATTTIWTRTAADTLGIIQRAFEASVRASDGTYAGYAMGHEVQDLLFQGRPMAEILSSLEQRWQVVRNLFPSEKEPPLIVSLFYTQAQRMALAIRGEVHLHDDLASSDFNPRQHVDALTTARNAAGLSEWYWKLLLVSLLADDVEHARSASERLRPWEFATAGQPFSIDITLLRAILAAKSGDTTALRKHAAFLRRAVATSSACQSRSHFVNGLVAWLSNKTSVARDAFVQGLAMARAEKNLILSGFIAEWLAVVCDRTGMPEAAHSYRELACSAFGAFGATIAVERLRGRTPDRISGRRDEPISTHSDASVIDLDLVLRASASITSEIRLEGLMRTLLTLVLQHAGAQRVILFTRNDDVVTVTAEADADGRMALGKEVDLSTAHLRKALDDAMRTNEPLIIEDAGTSDAYGHDPDVAHRSVRSVMVLPIAHSGTPLGALYLENNLTSNAFTTERVSVIRLLIGHVAVALENARLYDAQQRLLEAMAHFVPVEFLHHLGERSIVDITSGMAVRLPMTVLFADIRRFTTISEALSADATFSFLNTYLRLVEPIIRAHGGFIDKYIGDAVMALFPGTPSDAVHAAVEIQRALAAFNDDRAAKDLPKIAVGIGIHHGDVVLGTVGSVHRMDTTVIGDTVNVASRLEGLTKERGIGIVISDEVLKSCPVNGLAYEPIGSAAIRGRSQPILAYEVQY
ncbi:MAG: hypothetical protein RIR53_1762 [Bacteroidota bacterium]